MYFICKESGFTLIELIITLVILSILISISLPAYHQFRAQQEHSQLLPTLRNLINLSKNNAAIYHQHITICSSVNSIDCEYHQWNKNILVFSDPNKNNLKENTEQLHSQLKMDLNYGELTWHGNATHGNTIAFQGDTGLPRGSQGSFHYCSFSSPDKNTRYVVNEMGHIRTESISCN